MTIDKFLDITQPIRNKGNSLFLVTLMCEYIAVYACYTSLGNIILKCNHGIKSLSTRDISKVIFKHIDDCTDIYIDYKSTLYDISGIMAGVCGTYIISRPVNTTYYDSTIFT